MLCLKYPYISVAYNGEESFGGSQTMYPGKILSKSGCGLIAAADLLLYISKYHDLINTSELAAFVNSDIIAQRDYEKLLISLCRKYFPIIPYHGMNGLGLMAGMELFFRKNNIPYTCRWHIKDSDLWDKVSEMLENDIPVILAVGPNFPLFWRKGRTVLYTKTADDKYKAISSVTAHFVTITAMNEEWVKISSWGKAYYINRRKYEEYVSEYSAPLVSNILYIKSK